MKQEKLFDLLKAAVSPCECVKAAKYFYMLLRGPRGQRAHEYFKKRELSDEMCIRDRC